MGTSKKSEWLDTVKIELGWKVTAYIGPVPADPLRLDAVPTLPKTRGVTSRIGLKDGKVDKLVIAARPTLKHNGSHGQHTTAYAVTRESMQNAVPKGATEDQAKARVAKLFVNLSHYPGIEGSMGVDDDGFFSELSRMTDVRTWPENLTLADSLALYAEMRDCLPGATLPGEEHSHTTAGAEDKALNILRMAENPPEQSTTRTSGDDEADSQQPATKTVKAFLTLIDVAAIERLSFKDRQTQLEIFVRSISQAFPKAFNAPFDTETTIGEEIVSVLNASMINVDNPAAKILPDDLAQTCTAMAEELVPEDGTVRFDPNTFAAKMHKSSATKRIEFSFAGRPSSTKESNTQGDHLTSFRTVSKGVGQLLLQEGEKPTEAELANNVQALIQQFGPDRYVRMFPGLADELPPGTNMAEWIRTNSVLETPDKVYSRMRKGEHFKAFERMSSMQTACEALKKGLGSPDTPDAVVSDDRLLEIVELAVTMVDERPNAVVYSGVAKGHGEGTYGRQLDALEAGAATGKSGAADANDAFGLLCMQLDAAALKHSYAMFKSSAPTHAQTSSRGRTLKPSQKQKEWDEDLAATDEVTKVDPDQFRKLALEDFAAMARALYPSLCKLIEKEEALAVRLDHFIEGWQPPPKTESRKRGREEDDPSPGVANDMNDDATAPEDFGAQEEADTAPRQSKRARLTTDEAGTQDGEEPRTSQDDIDVDEDEQTRPQQTEVTTSGTRKRPREEPEATPGDMDVDEDPETSDRANKRARNH